MQGTDFIDAISATCCSGAVKVVKDQDPRVYDILHSPYNLFYDDHLKKNLSLPLAKKLIKKKNYWEKFSTYHTFALR